MLCFLVMFLLLLCYLVTFCLYCLYLFVVFTYLLIADVTVLTSLSVSLFMF